MNTHRARLSLSVTVAVATVLAAHVAAATEASAPTNALEEVVVMGQRTTLDVARAAQEQAPNLIDLMTAEQI